MVAYVQIIQQMSDFGRVWHRIPVPEEYVLKDEPDPIGTARHINGNETTGEPTKSNNLWDQLG